MIVARRYLVTGLVQGVGFRYFIEDAGRRDGMTGFIRNLDDGRVEAVVEGDVEAVERLERALRLGPPLARVDAVESEPLPPTGRYVGFEIRL